MNQLEVIGLAREFVECLFGQLNALHLTQQPHRVYKVYFFPGIDLERKRKEVREKVETERKQCAVMVSGCECVDVYAWL